MKNGKETLIYDGECCLCVRLMQQMKGRLEGGRIRFLPYRSQEASLLLGHGDRPGLPEALLLVDPTGEISRGADALLPLLCGPRIGKLLLPPARLLYHLIARSRYLLSGKASPYPGRGTEQMQRSSGGRKSETENQMDDAPVSPEIPGPLP